MAKDFYINLSDLPVGPKGDQGPPGEKGDPGSPGVPGRDGVDGAPGKDGKDGRDGKDGQRGPRGEKGEKGEPGETRGFIGGFVPPMNGTPGQVLGWVANRHEPIKWVDQAGGPGGDPEWGDIGGTLSNQTDLQTALDGKSDVGHTHDVYLTEAEADLLYDPINAVADHEAAGNPHPQYLTEDEADALYQAIGSSGGVATDPQGRLTLTSDTPVLTADVTAAGTIYYALYNGDQVPLYNGSAWTMTTFTELSQALSDNTKSPAAAANNSNYDMFVWSDSGTLRCTRGPAWSSDTARGTGAGTTEVERVNGRWVNKVSITNGPAAQRGTYVGSIRTNGSAQCAMMVNTAAASGGSGTRLDVWNMYNRVMVSTTNQDSGVSYAYKVGLRLWRDSAANEVLFIVGMAEDSFDAYATATATASATTVIGMISLGLDSTNAQHARSISGGAQPPAGGTMGFWASLRMPAPLGFHFVSPLEEGNNGTGTLTWLTPGSAGFQHDKGINFSLRM